MLEGTHCARPSSAAAHALGSGAPPILLAAGHAHLLATTGTALTRLHSFMPALQVGRGCCQLMACGIVSLPATHRADITCKEVTLWCLWQNAEAIHCHDALTVLLLTSPA